MIRQINSKKPFCSTFLPWKRYHSYLKIEKTVKKIELTYFGLFNLDNGRCFAFRGRLDQILKCSKIENRGLLMFNKRQIYKSIYKQITMNKFSTFLALVFEQFQ